MVTSHLPPTVSQQIERLNFPVPKPEKPEIEALTEFRLSLVDAHNRIRKIYDAPLLVEISNSEPLFLSTINTMIVAAFKSLI